MTTAPTPLVSVGLPVYNGASLIRRALDSLLAQDYPNFELIVSDNASTDGTWDILQEYAARDARIRLYRSTRNEGAAHNFNRVYELSGGEYFMWAAHDDWWEAAFISTCLEHMSQQPDVVVCYTAQTAFSTGQQQSELDHPEAWRRARSLLLTWPTPAVAIYGLFRRAALRPALPPLNLEGPDAVMLLHMALAGRIVILPENLHHYTRAPRSIKIRLQQMNRRVNVLNVWLWDFGLLWAALRLSQRAATDVRTRWLLLRAALVFASRATTWPRPKAMARRYSSLMSGSTYQALVAWLAQRPRLAAALRRITGLALRPAATEEMGQPRSGARSLEERDA